MVTTTILIVSGSHDLHARAVQRELQALGADVQFFACDTFDEHQLAFGFDETPHLRIGGRRVHIDEISTIWWRRPSLNQRLPDGVFDDDQVAFINRSCTRSLRAVLNASFRGRWISSPEATERAGDKLYQLLVARNHGFRVPDTLISNDPEAVRQFHERHDGNVIIKAAQNDGRVFLAAERFDLKALSDDQIRIVPSIYQELIAGTKHLRVNCFGHRVHCAFIESDQLDWRPDLNVPIGAYSLDADVERQVVELLDAFELSTGVMDIKISDEGELVWFEVNPQGQFLFLEPFTDQNLLRSFVEFLLEDVDRRPVPTENGVGDPADRLSAEVPGCRR